VEVPQLQSFPTSISIVKKMGERTTRIKKEVWDDDSPLSLTRMANNLQNTSFRTMR